MSDVHTAPATTAPLRWYVVHAYSGMEKAVERNLRERIDRAGMQDQFGRILVPTEEVVEVKNGKKSVTERRFFPGYVLVEMVMTDQSWYVVRNTPGVTGFVGSHGAGSKPAPLLDEEIQTILRSVGMTRNADFDAEVGDTITITEGAFAGQVGKITEIDSEKMKLHAMIDVFGRETDAELSFDQVERLV